MYSDASINMVTKIDFLSHITSSLGSIPRDSLVGIFLLNIVQDQSTSIVFNYISNIILQTEVRDNMHDRKW